MNKASIQIIVCDDGSVRFDICGDRDSDAVEIANDIMFAASECDVAGYNFEEGQEIQIH